jgi:hypothetical protein
MIPHTVKAMDTTKTGTKEGQLISDSAKKEDVSKAPLAIERKSHTMNRKQVKVWPFILF